MAGWLAQQPPEVRSRWLAELSEDDRAALLTDWRFLARPEQLPPPGDWTTWLFLGGRGAGKTRSGAEFTQAEVEAGRARRPALIGPTASDIRDVMVEGPTGILAVASSRWMPKYEPSKRRLTWPNGVRAKLFSAEEPERLRGPQHDFYWGDEPAAWRFPEAFDQLMLGLRLGTRPRGVLTTTPKPVRLIRDLVADDDVVITHSTTYRNRANLAAPFLKKIVKRYEGTRLGRQELLAELLSDVPGALWTHELIEKHRLHVDQRGKLVLPEIVRVACAIDPAVTRGEDADETGIIVGALGANDHVYIFEDLSGRDAPVEWALKVKNAHGRRALDVVVGEANNGGDLVELNVRAVWSGAPYKKVHASRGKRARAEPVSSLYERGLVHHVGVFPELEQELTSWVPDMGLESPNRHDALVWLVHELALQDQDDAVLDFYGEEVERQRRLKAAMQAATGQEALTAHG